MRYVLGLYSADRVFHGGDTLNILAKITANSLSEAATVILNHVDELIFNRGLSRYELISYFNLLLDTEMFSHVRPYFREDVEYEEGQDEEDIELWLDQPVTDEEKEQCLNWARQNIDQVVECLRGLEQDLFLAEDSHIFVLIGNYAENYHDAPEYE